MWVQLLAFCILRDHAPQPLQRGVGHHAVDNNAQSRPFQHLRYGVPST